MSVKVVKHLHHILDDFDVALYHLQQQPPSTDLDGHIKRLYRYVYMVTQAEYTDREICPAGEGTVYSTIQQPTSIDISRG